MVQVSSKNQFSYSIIPFAECVVSGIPIRAFVTSNQKYAIDTDIDTTKVTDSEIKTSFTKEELSMSNIKLQTYMKYNNFSDDKKLEYKKARRRYNNCIYAKRSREKRKNKKTLLSNTLNDSSIDEQVEQVEQVVQVVQVVQDDQVIQDDQNDQYDQVEQDDQNDHEIIEDLPDLIHYTYISYIQYIPYIPYIYT